MDGFVGFLGKVGQAERLLKIAAQTPLKHFFGDRIFTPGQQHDPHVWIETLQFLEDHVARHAGHQEVEKHHADVPPALLVKGNGFLWAGGGVHDIAMALQSQFQKAQKTFLVINGENAAPLWTVTVAHTPLCSKPLAMFAPSNPIF